MTPANRHRFVHRSQFHQLLQRSAFLAREFLGQVETHRFRKTADGRQHKIVYVFDTSIVAALTAPWMVGPLQGLSRHGLGQLMPRMYQVSSRAGLTEDDRRMLRQRRGAEDRLAIRLTELLARAAVGKSYDELDQVAPEDGDKKILWQLTPHHDETTGMRAAIGRRAADVVAGKNNLAAEERRRQFYRNATMQSLINLSNRPNQISIENLLDIVIDELMSRENLTGSGIAKQSDMLSTIDSKPFSFGLLRGYGIKRTDDLDEDDPEMTPVARAFLERYWQEKLQSKHHAIADDATRVERDAAALAELAIRNRRLLEHDVPVRIVFVTGDRNLVEASYSGDDRIQAGLSRCVDRYYPRDDFNTYRQRMRLLEQFFSAPVSGVPKGQSWFDRFSIHYVRHLHAFAHDELAEGQKTDHLMTFFTGLFVREAESILQDRAMLEDFAVGRETLEAPSVFKQDYLDTIKEWDELARRKVKQRRFASWETHLGPDAKESLRKIVEEDLRRKSQEPVAGKDWFKATARWMTEFVDRTRDRTMLQFSNIGTDLLESSDGRWIARNPPDLYFFHLENTRRIFRQLSSPRGYQNVRIEKLHADFDKIVEDVPKDQRSDGRLESHLKFLALGAAFAAADRWSVAESHAERARAIIMRADNDVIPPIPAVRGDNKEMVCEISGREASFLLAMCKRIRAETVDDLKGAEQALAMSRAALDDDMAVEKSAELNKIASREILYLRDDTERLSIALSRYYLTRARCGVKGCGNGQSSAPCDRCKDACLDLLNTSAALYRPEMVTRLDDKAPILTAMTLANNIVQLNAVSRFWVKTWAALPAPTDACPWLEDRVFMGALSCLDRIASKQLHVFNGTVTAYLSFGRYLAAQRGLGIENPPTAEDVASDLSKLDNHIVTTYDQWRFDRLAAFITAERTQHRAPNHGTGA